MFVLLLSFSFLSVLVKSQIKQDNSTQIKSDLQMSTTHVNTFVAIIKGTKQNKTNILRQLGDMSDYNQEDGLLDYHVPPMWWHTAPPPKESSDASKFHFKPDIFNISSTFEVFVDTTTPLTNEGSMVHPPTPISEETTPGLDIYDQNSTTSSIESQSVVLTESTTDTTSLEDTRKTTTDLDIFSQTSALSTTESTTALPTTQDAWETTLVIDVSTQTPNPPTTESTMAPPSIQDIWETTFGQDVFSQTPNLLTSDSAMISPSTENTRKTTSVLDVFTHILTPSSNKATKTGFDWT